VNTLRAQLIFPSKTNFCNLFEFPITNSTQKSISSTPSLWNCEINFIKFDSPKAFQQHQECPQFSIYFSISILFNFPWKNGSIINSFHTIDPNNLKPSRRTFKLLINNFLKIPRAWHKVPWFKRSYHDNLNKTNYLAS